MIIVVVVVVIIGWSDNHLVAWPGLTEKECFLFADTGIK